jgi:hypothetical protein
MKFNSVKEYFYKLNSVAYQLMMIPMILFILYYAQPLVDLTFLKVDVTITYLIGIVIASVIVAALTIVQIYVWRKASSIALNVGLGIKLEKLGTLLLTKMKLLAAISCLMPLALLFTANNYFTLGFAFLLCWYFIQWPAPGRVCRLLKLKGDERELIISRGEAFRGL